jgi:hypothetical protein
MQIKIEIDVKPEELRRFLGLPDVAGLQEDLVNFLRDKLGAETFDPTGFVREGVQIVRDSGAWKKLLSAAKVSAVVGGEEDPPAARRKSGGRTRKAAPRPAAKPASDEAEDAEG